MDPFGEIVRSCVLTASQEDILRSSHFHGETVDDLDVDPFAEILRSCFLTASQEEYLCHSDFHGQSIQNLAAPSTARGDEEGLGLRITEASSGIFIRSSPRDSPEDQQEVEVEPVSEECPSHVRQTPAPKPLEISPLQAPADETPEKFPLQTSADKTSENCPLQTSADETSEKSSLQTSADKTKEKSTMHPPLQNIGHAVRQISAEKTLEKPPAVVRHTPPYQSKRKSAVEVELGCSTGIAAKKSRAERTAGEHSIPAGETPNILNDSLAQPPNEEQQPSDVHDDTRRILSDGGTGLPVDEFSNFRSSNFNKLPSLRQFKEALGIDNSKANNDCLRRKLPSSIQGPSDENGGCPAAGVGKLISETKGFGHSRSTLLLNVAEALSKKSGYGTSKESVGTENGSILEAAKQAGYAFPRPRWWHPEGYTERRS